MLGSIYVKFYYKETNVHYICNFDSPTKIANKGYAESSSSMRPSGDGEMKIYVQSEDYGNYALEVNSSNTIEDVLITVLGKWPGALYFNGHRLLETAKSLADYSIEDGSILHLDVFELNLVHIIETPNVIPEKKRIIITDQPLAIWEKEHDKILLSLLVEQISNGGEENILHGGEDSWCNIVAKFNESTGLQYEHKHLFERFNFYRREYHIVNRIRHHPKFSWDHKCHVVIATDAEWNEYIKQNPDARPYRTRAIPYVDLLGILFANTEV